MATKKETGGTRYVVLREWGGHQAGDVIDVDQADAAFLIRDGMIAEEPQT